MYLCTGNGYRGLGEDMGEFGDLFRPFSCPGKVGIPGTDPFADLPRSIWCRYKLYTQCFRKGFDSCRDQVIKEPGDIPGEFLRVYAREG